MNVDIEVVKNLAQKVKGMELKEAEQMVRDAGLEPSSLEVGTIVAAIALPDNIFRLFYNKENRVEYVYNQLLTDQIERSDN